MNAWFGWALLSAVFAALTAIFTKLGLQHVDADFATWFRTIVVALLLSAFVFATGKWINPLQLQIKTLYFLVLSAFATGASWLCYYRALQIGDAAKVAPIDKFSIVLVVIMAVAFLGERPSVKDWSGIGLITAGVLLLAF